MGESTITKSQSVGYSNDNGQSRIAEYRRKRNTGTWHWSTRCSAWPKTDYFVNQTRPDPMLGEPCAECEKLGDTIAQQKDLATIK